MVAQGLGIDRITRIDGRRARPSWRHRAHVCACAWSRKEARAQACVDGSLVWSLAEALADGTRAMSERWVWSVDGVLACPLCAPIPIDALPNPHHRFTISLPSIDSNAN